MKNQKAQYALQQTFPLLKFLTQIICPFQIDLFCPECRYKSDETGIVSIFLPDSSEKEKVYSFLELIDMENPFG